MNVSNKNPELYSEEDRRKLADAARAIETTSQFFQTEPSAGRDLFGAQGESFITGLIKSGNQAASSIARNTGNKEAAEFFDSVVREFNFVEDTLIDNDPESIASIAGNLSGSTLQTVAAMLSGVGAVGLFTLYGTQGAGGNLETYRQVARENGFDPRQSEEMIVGLGGAIISGSLGQLSGKSLETIPGVRGFIQNGQRALVQQATRESLFQIGKQAITGTLKNKQTLGQALKLSGRFALSSGVVEGFEEVTEELANEALLQLTVEEYENDPEAFAKQVGFAGLGGLLGGVAIGPAARFKLRKQIDKESYNMLGLEHINPRSREEAAAELKKLHIRESQLRDKLTVDLPSSVAQDLSQKKAELSGLVAGRIDLPTGESARILGTR